MTSTSDATVVLSGRHGELTWQVVNSVDDDEMTTLLRVHRGEDLLVVGSGFEGPGLYTGERINHWYGRSDGLPFFVMARAEPSVTRIWVETTLSQTVTLTMSDVIPEFGLTFAAAVLPPGARPTSFGCS